MRKLHLIGASVIAMFAAQASGAQTADTGEAANPANADDAGGIADIVVTAQRSAEPLQQVPIAVSAFSAEALKAQQINTTSDLQLTLPNITYTKSNFTSSSSFNIRGIGDLCVGVTCDAATAIHINDLPAIGSPIFQNEFHDVERIEILRGPQGTLFGRNATGGVINLISARPDLSRFQAAVEGEYGNYDSYRIKGMVNIPVGDILGVRLAGYYLKRDGFTFNTFTGNRIDGRDQFDIRGSIRFQPGPDTTIDIIGNYFREHDNRSRYQKQLCHRDPTGVLGCLPDSVAFETTNANATFTSTLSSREFLSLAFAGTPLAAAAPALALGSVYGAGTYITAFGPVTYQQDAFAGVVNPADFRTARLDVEPEFFTDEKRVQLHVDHDFGGVSVNLSGSYSEGGTDSKADYYQNIQNSFATNPGLNNLNTFARPGAPLALFNPVRTALIPNGTGSICQSLNEFSGSGGSGVYGGNGICALTSLDFDRSTAFSRAWSAEAIVETEFDGAFNFLLGGIYYDSKTRDNNYFVNSFAIDYVSGVLGAANSGGAAYLATPYFQSDSKLYRLKSYGIFGEAYVEFADRFKLTAGLRYNNDDKFVVARTSLAAFPALFGQTNAFASPFFPTFDADPSIAGNQDYARTSAKFDKVTGRAVLDFQITARNLLYASYSRGYKSGGVNPPLTPVFAVPITFGPEQVDAFEIGSKNTFLGGTLRFNLTAFYYKYKQLQLSRIVARTAVNDNVDANIYGLEAEAVIKPSRSVLVNLGASYLRTKISQDKFLVNTQDPGAGRADAVVVKDLQAAFNCVVTANNGSPTLSNTFVGVVNTVLGTSAGNPALLRAPVPLPGTNNTAAFSLCGQLTAAATGTFPAAGQTAINALVTGNPATVPGVTVSSSGVAVNIRGNRLPQAPSYKFSAGIQYTADFGDWNVVPRVDLAYTGGYFGSIFNRNVNRIQGYEVVNAQIQVNGPDERFFIRGFVQNLTKNNAVTGLYVTDQSSGLFTNAFTLEPRRYGIAAGVKF